MVLKSIMYLALAETKRNSSCFGYANININYEINDEKFLYFE